MEFARFTIFRSDENNQYYFNLRSRTGEVILFSKMYPTREACFSGISEAKTCASIDITFERINLTFDYSFNLRGKNGTILARSASYTTSSARENGIECIKRDAFRAMVEDIAEV